MIYFQSQAAIHLRACSSYLPAARLSPSYVMPISRSKRRPYDVVDACQLLKFPAAWYAAGADTISAALCAKTRRAATVNRREQSSLRTALEVLDAFAMEREVMRWHADD